ncbi:MAG: ATP-dependent 6-phosphofructokinase [Myxococcaceae bacterium]
MKKLAVLTSGGDSPGMNAALRAIAKLCAARGVQVVGVLEDYEGLMDARFRDLTRPTDSGLGADLELDHAGGQGGTLIGSARSMRFMKPEGRAKAAEVMKAHGLEGLIVIGGNGSLTGAHALATEHGVKVIGIPASIDNDIGCSATALGVDTALNTIIEATDRISDTARAHKRAFVVEVMGRQCGYLAMGSAIAAAADAVLYREAGKSEAEIVQSVCEVIKKGFARGKRRVLIIKAEGVQVSTTELVKLAEQKLAGELGYGAEIRATVLGHVVRGGNPTYQDRLVAGRLGLAAVEALLKGQTDEMVAWQPPISGGTVTQDSSVHRFPLEVVLRETAALIDGTSPVTKKRLQLMEHAAGVLPL